ncbi:hypothetical protein L3X38_034344 [Prunus dulcis]|uniref:Uncharacterized protein n=1 Tax=Prunus dulcis TaxID=3755 RepID=A0AAD4YXT4_PRUDU|nr:hypothetical protein L3X38_034344 [Prunus dulcis]
MMFLASLQADTERYNLHERHLAQQKNDPNLQGRSTDEVVASDRKEQSQPPTINNNNEAKHDDDNDANESYGKKKKRSAGRCAASFLLAPGYGCSLFGALHQTLSRHLQGSSSWPSMVDSRLARVN